MAKKTIFQTIDSNAVTNLGIEEGVEYGVYTTSSLSELSTVLGTEDDTSYQNIRDLLTTETTNSLTSLKKGFVLPGCSVSADRLKEACKEHSICLTNDYEQADFIITEDDIEGEMHGSQNPYPTRSLLVTWTNGYMLGNTEDNCDHLGKKFKDYTEDLLNPDYIIYDKRMSNIHALHNLDYESAPYDNYLITGLAINLASLIKVNLLHVVDVETILSASSNVQELTVELVDQMISMWNAGGEDREMLGALLCTIDHTKTPALLWKLAQTLGNQEYHWSRNKDVKYWYTVSDLSDLGNYSAEDIIVKYISDGVMDSENFKMLEPICREEIYIQNRELYSFTVQVKPEYRKYLKK